MSLGQQSIGFLLQRGTLAVLGADIQQANLGILNAKILPGIQGADDTELEQKLRGDVKFLRRIETSVDYVPDQGDSLKRLIAYVLNNPVKAGMKCVPQGYEWSSARCYFNTIQGTAGDARLGELSVREKRRILHTKEYLPDNWKINSDNYVIPESYVDIDEVERIFRSSRSFEFFLSVSHAGKKLLGENISFSDEMLQAAMAELLDKKFGVSNVNELDDFLKKNMIKELRSRFSASAKQLARVTFMSVSDVLRYLE